MNAIKQISVPGGWTVLGEPELIRCGEVPACGRSRNHRDGLAERGVSAYWAVLARDESDGEVAYIVQTAGLDLVSTASIIGRMSTWGDGTCTTTLVRLTGPVVGRGSDGEPLVAVTDSERVETDLYGEFPWGWAKATARK